MAGDFTDVDMLLDKLAAAVSGKIPLHEILCQSFEKLIVYMSCTCTCIGDNVILLSEQAPQAEVTAHLHNFESFAYLLTTTAEQMSVAGFHSKRRVSESILLSLKKVRPCRKNTEEKINV